MATLLDARGEVLDNLNSLLDELDLCELDPRLAARMAGIIERIQFWLGKANSLGMDSGNEAVVCFAQRRLAEDDMNTVTA